MMSVPSGSPPFSGAPSALARLAAALNGSLRLDEVLTQVLEQAFPLVSATAAGCIALYDAASSTWRIVAWKDPRISDLPISRARLPRDSGMLGWLLESRDLVEAPDTRSDRRITDAYRGVLPRSLTAVPLVLKGAVAGALVLSGLPKGDEQRAELRALGELAAVAIANAQQFEESQRIAAERTRVAAENARLARRLTALQDIGAAIGAERELERVLDVIVARTQEVFDSVGCQISLLDDDPTTYTVAAVVAPGAAYFAGRRIPVANNSLSAHVIRTGRLAISNDPLNDRRVDHERILRFGSHNLMSAPLRARGRVLGALSVINKLAGPFNQEDADVLLALAQQAALAIDNARLFAEHQRRLHDSEEIRLLIRDVADEAVQAVSQGDAWTPVALLRLMIGRASALTGADGLGFAMPDSDGIPRWVAAGGVLASLEGAPVAAESLARRSLQKERSLVAQASAEAGQEGLRTAVAAPMAAPMATISAKASGVLLLGWLDGRPVSEATVMMIERLARLADTAVQNGVLARQSRELAAMRERERLARDLHDSVTQSLFAINTLAQVLPALWEAHPEQARQSQAQLQRLAEDTLTEMRALLTQMRPPALQDEGLPVALRHLVDSYTDNTGVEVELTVRGQSRPAPAVEDALFRIAQEALSNARRHSGAGAVSVGLALEDDAATLEVRDNGRGFDPRTLRSVGGHLGLLGMKERAQQAGGQFTLDTAPGRGAAVRVRLPRRAVAGPE
ncbi:MAG: GAF domain-containing protein [Chloroflexi bacterium]|nr:GAF domain-containing protein [Chloroflexota bacterium]